MRRKPVTYTIPEKLDVLLHAKVGRGNLSEFVTQALWDALRKDEEAFAKEMSESNSDPANLELRKDFEGLEGEDFVGLDDW